MSLSCLHAPFPPTTINYIKLYDDNNDNGHLWMGHGTPPDCSSTSPPSPSSCVVCLQQGVYAVCSDLQQRVKLVMEASDQPLEIIKSECPRLLGDAMIQNTTESPLSSPDMRERWPIFVPILIFLIITALMVYCIWKKYRLAKVLLTQLDAVDVKPEAEAEEKKFSYHQPSDTTPQLPVPPIPTKID